MLDVVIGLVGDEDGVAEGVVELEEVELEEVVLEKVG